MPFNNFPASNGLEVETEHLICPIKVYDSPERNAKLFTCQVVHAGNGKARIMAAHGHITLQVIQAMREWVLSRGFTSFCFERGDPKQGQRSRSAKVEK